MLAAFKNTFKIPELRKKILITCGFLILYRIGSFITLPGIDPAKLAEMQKAGGSLNELMGQISMLTGGALAQCTLFALGIMPYISASIIFSLLVKVIPALDALQKEGATGRQKINQYTRYATVGLCLIQSVFIVIWINQSGLAYDASVGFWFMTILSLTTGTVFLMWVGEQITEFGIGNGISLIIMGGIIAAMPPALFTFVKDIKSAAATGDNVPMQVLKLVVFIALFVGVVAAVVIMHRGQRRIALSHQKFTRGGKTFGGQRHYLPIRVNMAGVMPVIFADSLILFPTALISQIWPQINDILSRGDSFWYFTLYIAMVMFFTFFWISLTFSPQELAQNLKEHGSFIPGIRPGKRTEEHLEAIMNRISFVGAVFLAFIGLFPTVVSVTMGINMLLASFLGGTGLLIVVQVSLDLVEKVESHLLMRHYEGFMKTGRVRGRAAPGA